MIVSKSYCQRSSSADSIITADSFARAMNKKNRASTGKPLPQFSVISNGKNYSNKKIKGKVVFINFWFAACAPCIAEMNELNKLYECFSKNKNFDFISFTFEDSNEIAIIKKRYNIHYNIISISQDECYRLNNNNGFPTSIILDNKGVVKFIHPTDELKKAEIKKYFTTKIYPLIKKELAGKQ